MNGIASSLDLATSSKVDDLWKDLETNCGLSNSLAPLFPHISWQVTESYNQTQLHDTLKYLAYKTKPFVVRTAGIGLFTGENPVIYISIVKDKHIVHFHSFLWKQLSGIAIQPSAFYHPDQWVPHITLAYNNVNRTNLECAMKNLAFREFNWDIRVENLIFVSQEENKSPDTFIYQLGQ